MYSMFHSVEFYVIIFAVAALLVGVFAVPQGRGQAETTFATASREQMPPPEPGPCVEFRTLADGRLQISRFGLTDLPQVSVALAITKIGFDVTIEERTTPLRRGDDLPAAEPNAAVFILDNIAQERYHFKYNSEATSSFAALTYRNTPGMSTVRPLRQA